MRARQRQTDSAPPGVLVPLYDRHIHLLVQGEGPLTVLLDGADGAGTFAEEAVARNLAGRFRVVRYDRAGFGWSDPSPVHLAADDSAQDLRTALKAAGIDGPFLLVGQGYGADILRHFAHRFRREIAGLVLRDPQPPGFAAAAPASWRRSVRRARRKLAIEAFLARHGPDASEASARYGEAVSRAENDRLAQALPHLGDLPLTVVSTELPESVSLLPRSDAAQAEGLWRRLQLEMSQSSNGGRFRSPDGAGANASSAREEIVISAVLEMAGAAGGDSYFRTSTPVLLTGHGRRYPED